MNGQQITIGLTVLAAALLPLLYIGGYFALGEIVDGGQCRERAFRYQFLREAYRPMLEAEQTWLGRSVHGSFYTEDGSRQFEP